MATFTGTPILVGSDINRLVSDVSARHADKEVGFTFTDKLLIMSIIPMSDLDMATLVMQLQVLYPGAF